MAEALQCPVRDLPGDADLVRGYAIVHLIQRRGGSEALMAKAMHRTLDDKPPHERREWAERVKILERRLAHHQQPNSNQVHYLEWWCGDLVDLLNSEVVVALPEVEILRQSRPELHEFVCSLPEAEHVMEILRRESS